MKLSDFSYPSILDAIAPFSATGRSESASFLIWYLVNMYRLDDIEAVDAVCDQKGDKGVDGIYVNEGNGTIDVFQCRVFQSDKKVGDTALKEFSGTLTQFASPQSIENILNSAGDIALTRLIKNTNLISLLPAFQVRGIFLTNSDVDANGEAFLKHAQNIDFEGPSQISEAYISDKKDALQQGAATFDISGLLRATYVVDKDTHTVIAPVLASELVALKGIDDQSLFSLNVRASLGNTKVNRDIVASIKDKSLHKLFPLFHNGVTVLAETVNSTDDQILIKNYFVVNGCQSLNALFRHTKELTSELRVLTKFIQVPADSKLSGLITAYSNNQNGVKARDFKSNNPIQTRLQNEMLAKFSGRYSYEVKRGEPLAPGKPISNENAGLYLIAFDLKEPWTTHRKYQVFDEKYVDIFGRPEVTAARIVFCHELIGQIQSRVGTLKNQLVGKYVLTQFYLLYVLRRVFDADPFGAELIKEPELFVNTEFQVTKLRKFIGQLLDGLMIDFNLETEELGSDFDYRGKLREKEFLTKLTNDLLSSYLKDIKRGKALPLQSLWDTMPINN
jgi:hypothetical protein